MRNPEYERIKVTGKIALKAGYTACHKELLLKEINQFIAGVQAQYRLGGSIHLSEVSHFIKNHPYVAQVEELGMAQLCRDPQGKYSLFETTHTGADSNKPQVLSLAATDDWKSLSPDTNHLLQTGLENQNIELMRRGVGNLVIGGDFVIGKNSYS